MAEKEPIKIKKFNGGWVTSIKSDTINLDQSPDLENVDFDDGGSVKKDTGHSELGTDTGSDPSTDLMVAPDRSGVEWLFKKQGEYIKIYDSVNEVYSIIKDGLTVGDRLGHEYFDTVLYCLSKTDTPFIIDLSKITRLDGAVSTGDAVINVDSTAAFDSSGTIYINDQAVTYSGKTATSFTGCSGAVDTDDNYLVVQATVDHATIPAGNISALFAGRLWVASGTTSVLYSSKLLDFTNFTVAGTGAGDAIQVTIESRVNSLRTFYDDNNQLRLMAFAANNVTYSLDVDDNESLSSTVVTKQIFKEGVSAINQFATVVGPNDLYHIDLNNQVRTLGQRFASQGVNKQVSDNASVAHKELFREHYHFDEARGIVHNEEYWCLARDDSDEPDGSYNNRIIILDLISGAWRVKKDINANDIKIYNNQIIFSDAVSNKVYVRNGALSNNGSAIKFKYSIPDIDVNPMTFERLRAARVTGFISSNCTATVKIYRDFKTSLIGEFTLSGDNSDIVGVDPDNKGVFGSMLFGEEIIGGGGTKENYKFFIAQLDLSSLPDLENFRMVFENNEANVYFEITGIKPFIMPQDENYFPEEYILSEN